jgi:hypothetical protein
MGSIEPFFMVQSADSPPDELLQERRAQMSQRRRLLRRDQHLRAIAWDRKGNRFLCGDKPLGLQHLGSLISHALSKGEKEIRLTFELRYPGTKRWHNLWSAGFTVDYLLDMLRFVAERGWFWDAVDNGDDHKFDGARITPGIHWTQVEELRSQSACMFQRAKLHAVEGGNASMADEFRANARRLTAQAERLLRLDVPPRQSA